MIQTTRMFFWRLWGSNHTISNRFEHSVNWEKFLQRTPKYQIKSNVPHDYFFFAQHQKPQWQSTAAIHWGFQFCVCFIVDRFDCHTFCGRKMLLAMTVSCSLVVLHCFSPKSDIWIFAKRINELWMNRERRVNRWFKSHREISTLRWRDNTS